MVDSWKFYNHIKDPLASVVNVSNAAVSTQLLASTTLRNVLGTKSLSEILTDRENTATIILEQLDTATDPWGIKVGPTSSSPAGCWPQAGWAIMYL